MRNAKLNTKRITTTNGGWLTFLDGWRTGISIAITYSILTSLYFLSLLILIGPKLMQQEGETSYVKAFAGVTLGFAAFGAVYSAIIALLLRKKLTMNIGGC